MDSFALMMIIKISYANTIYLLQLNNKSPYFTYYNGYVQDNKHVNNKIFLYLYNYIYEPIYLTYNYHTMSIKFSTKL